MTPSLSNALRWPSVDAQMGGSKWLGGRFHNHNGLRTMAQKRVVITIERPWSQRNLGKIHEAPIAKINVTETQVIANGGRNIQSRVPIPVGSGTLSPKNIFQVVCLKGTHIFPLRVTDSSFVANLNPATFANRLTIADKCIPEPGNHLRRLRLGVILIVDIIVREGDVKRILARKKVYRNK